MAQGELDRVEDLPLHVLQTAYVAPPHVRHPREARSRGRPALKHLERLLEVLGPDPGSSPPATLGLRWLRLRLGEVVPVAVHPAPVYRPPIGRAVRVLGVVGIGVGMGISTDDAVAGFGRLRPPLPVVAAAARLQPQQLVPRADGAREPDDVADLARADPRRLGRELFRPLPERLPRLGLRRRHSPFAVLGPAVVPPPQPTAVAAAAAPCGAGLQLLSQGCREHCGPCLDVRRGDVDLVREDALELGREGAGVLAARDEEDRVAPRRLGPLWGAELVRQVPDQHREELAFALLVRLGVLSHGVQAPEVDHRRAALDRLPQLRPEIPRRLALRRRKQLEHVAADQVEAQVARHRSHEHLLQRAATPRD
mmetsp:Transcript_32391/g.78849  ORF Transcript_32391/g.78849 Transcript_32391/m.78849 type:complete len:367 (-) Transcript_32391:411-1511(-)